MFPNFLEKQGDQGKSSLFGENINQKTNQVSLFGNNNSIFGKNIGQTSSEGNIFNSNISLFGAPKNNIGQNSSSNLFGTSDNNKKNTSETNKNLETSKLPGTQSNQFLFGVKNNNDNSKGGSLFENQDNSSSNINFLKGPLFKNADSKPKQEEGLFSNNDTKKINGLGTNDTNINQKDNKPNQNQSLFGNFMEKENIPSTEAKESSSIFSGKKISFGIGEKKENSGIFQNNNAPSIGLFPNINNNKKENEKNEQKKDNEIKPNDLLNKDKTNEENKPNLFNINQPNKENKINDNDNQNINNNINNNNPLPNNNPDSNNLNINNQENEEYKIMDNIPEVPFQFSDCKELKDYEKNQLLHKTNNEIIEDFKLMLETQKKKYLKCTENTRILESKYFEILKINNDNETFCKINQHKGDNIIMTINNLDARYKNLYQAINFIDSKMTDVLRPYKENILNSDSIMFNQTNSEKLKFYEDFMKVSKKCFSIENDINESENILAKKEREIAEKSNSNENNNGNLGVWVERPNKKKYFVNQNEMNLMLTECYDGLINLKNMQDNIDNKYELLKKILIKEVENKNNHY